MASFTFLTAGESHALNSRSSSPACRHQSRSETPSARLGPRVRMKIETDEAEVTSGVRGGETLGPPIANRKDDDDGRSRDRTVVSSDVDDLARWRRATR